MGSGRKKSGRGDGDWRRADESEVGVLGFEELRVYGAAESRKLEENVRTVSVDCFYNLWEVGVR